MTEKVTTMVLKVVDLKCPSCYKKIKKLLCKYPQIRNQVFDEKQNTVTITVVCCNPEKIRDKLCCKGGKTIKSIEIIKPPPPKQPEKKKEPEKPKEAEKPKPPAEKPKDAEKPKEPEKPKEAEKPKGKEPDKPKSNGKPAPPKEAPPAPKPQPAPAPAPPKKPPPEPAPPKAPEPVPPPPMPVPAMPHLVATCCGPCYEGRGGGPCYHGYARPVPWYDNYGYGPYCACGGCRGGYASRCDYFSEESPTGCTIM